MVTQCVKREEGMKELDIYTAPPLQQGCPEIIQMKEVQKLTGYGGSDAREMNMLAVTCIRVRVENRGQEHCRCCRLASANILTLFPGSLFPS